MGKLVCFPLRWSANACVLGVQASRLPGCVSISWHSSGKLGARLPVGLPGLFEKDTAQGKQGVEIGDIPEQVQRILTGVTCAGIPYVRWGLMAFRQALPLARRSGGSRR